MANERFSSRLISEGTLGGGAFGSFRSTIVTAVVLTAAGIVLVWVLFFLLATVS
jgi:hypothetical protein